MLVSRYATVVRSIRRHVIMAGAALAVMTCVYSTALAPVADGAAGARTADPVAEALNFDDAIALALAASPEVAAAERALELARMRLAAAEALRRPMITL
ncbi:MAG: hypothetical protein AB1563_13020, partial [Bacillota bacterium]